MVICCSINCKDKNVRDFYNKLLGSGKHVENCKLFSEVKDVKSELAVRKAKKLTNLPIETSESGRTGINPKC